MTHFKWVHQESNAVLSMSTAFEPDARLCRFEKSNRKHRYLQSQLVCIYQNCWNLAAANMFALASSNQINWLKPESFQAISSNLYAF